MKLALQQHEDKDIAWDMPIAASGLMQAAADGTRAGGSLAAVQQELSQLLTEKPALGSRRPHARLLLAAHHGSKTELDAAVAALRCAPTVPWGECVEAAAQAGRVAAVSLLLSQCKPDVAGECVTAAFRIAAQRGHLPLVDHLLDVWRAEATADDCEPLWLAAENGHLPVVERLLQEDGVSPAAGGGAALWLAAREGHLPVVERLLADPRCEPAASSHAAVRFASRSGHISVLQHLLADTRLSDDELPAAVLAEALWHSRLEATACLLQDPRIDAAAVSAEIVLEGIPAASQFALLRQPSVLRARTSMGAEQVRHCFQAADVRAFSSMAWHRRRHVVLAWAEPQLVARP